MREIRKKRMVDAVGHSRGLCLDKFGYVATYVRKGKPAGPFQDINIMMIMWIIN